MEQYEFEGTVYNVAPNRLEEFKSQFPGAKLVEENLEKTTGSQTEDATASQVDTASISDDGSSAFPYDDTKDKHDVLLNITTKDKNLQGNFITKPNYAFFDKSEEDAIGDLVMKYPGFEFEETNIIGDDRSSFNAIKVSKGDKSIKVEFNIDGGASTDDPRTLEAVGKYNQEGIDSLNTAEKGLLISYQSKNQAYKKSYEDLTSFIDENSTSEDDKLYLKQNQERSALTLDFLEKTKPTEDQLNTIETDIVNNEDLFKVKEEEVNLFRGVGMDAKIGVAPRSYVKKTQPYAKELQQTEKKLIANGVKPEDITRDLVEQKTRDYLARIANKEAWNKNTEVSLEELDDIDQIKVAYNRDYSLTPTIKDKIELGLKEFEKEYVAKIVHRDALQEQLKEGKLANKLKTAVERFDSEDYDFTQVKMQPGEGLITLDTGKQIPESVYGQYQKDYKEYNELYNNYLELSSDIVKNLDNGFINRVPEQLDLTRRNYNAVEEAVVETGLGFLEMAVDAGYGTAKLFGDPSLNDDAQIEFKNKINNIRQSYKRDVEFDDAFSSLENFVSFATQEAVNQVPIFTALATPMGWGLIGTSSFGSQYSDMVKQDKEIGATKTSNAEKYFKSLGYAGAELVFGAAPTYMLIRDAKKALVNNVAKNAMEKIKVGEYVKNNLITPNTFTAVAGEPIGEGLTQLTQNAINGRPLTEGVDHAMFSGLMFGPTLASVPFFKGLYLSQFSDADTRQQIRIFRAEQVELGKTNEQLKRGGKSISDKVQQRKDKIFNENQNRIEELQELINLEVQATESKVKTLSNKAAEAYISLISAQESTRLEAQEVRKDGFLSEKQKNDKLLLLKQKFDNLQDNLEQFRKSDTYNNNWSLFEADDKNKSEVDRLRKEAELALLEQEGITDVNEEQINDKARIMYNTEVILKDIAKKTKRKTTALRNTLVSHETVEETIEYLEKDAKEKINNLDPSLSETQRQRVVESINNNLANNISEVQQGAHGFMISNSNNEDVSVVNVENMAKDDRLETKTHELQHVVFANAIGLDDSSYIGLAEQVLMWTEQNNKDAYQRINTFAERNSDGSLIAKEVVALFFEEAAAGNINLEAKKNKTFSGLLGFLISDGTKKSTDIEIDLAGETDAIKFLVGLAKKIKNDQLTLAEFDAVRKNKIIQEIRGVKPKKGDVEFSKARKTVLEEINTLLPEGINTKEDYNKFLDDPRSFMKLYEATQDDGVISNYVKSRTTNRAEFEEAIDSVIMRLRNFDPSKQRKEGGVVGRGGFGEFVFANTNFGKLDARKALAIKAEQAKETTSLDAEESFVQVADESAAFDEDVTPTKEKAKKPKINVLRIGKVGGKEKQIVDGVQVKEGDTFKEVLADNTGKVGQIIFDVPSAKLTDATKNLTYAKKIVDGVPESSEAGNIQAFFSDAETVRSFIKILPKTNVSEDTGDINLLGENIDTSRDVLGLGLGTSNNVLKYFYNKTTKRSKGKKSQPFIWELKDEFTNPSKEQIEQFQEALGITPRGQLNNYDRNTGQLLKGAAKMMAGQASLSAAQRQLEAKGAPKQQVADITAAQSKISFSKSGKIIASDEMMKVMFSKSQGKRAAEAFGYDHLDLNKEEAKEDLVDWVKNVGSKVMPRSFWEANGNLIGSGAKYKTLTIDGQEVKQYSLKGGGTILETDPDFSSYELNLMPEGKMVFANKAQMNEAFKDVEFAPENKNVKDSTKRITLYGKKTGEQVKKLIDKKKDFLSNSDKGFIDTWMAIAKDIDQNPDNRRFWAAWLEVTPQNMSHFMRVGAKLSFYNTLDLKNVEEHTSPATDFAFALWAFANSRDKKGNQILTEALLKKSMESYIQGSLPKIFDNLLKGDGFDYIATIPKEYRLQVIAGEIPVWIRYINDKVNAQKYTLDGVEYSGVNPNVIILANGKTLAQNYGLGIDKKLHFYQGAISTQQDLLFKVFKGEITEANAKKQLDKYVEGTKILKLDTKAKAKMSNAITNVRSVLAYSKTSRGMSTFDFDETLIIDGENFVVATKDGETVKIPSDKWPIDGPRYAAEGYNFDFSDFVNVRGGKEGPLLQKMKNQIKKYGTSNVFVLTARMQDAAEPIHKWLKSKGINIPLENITGLGKSEGDAKAQWFIDKYAEGYNDMYFVDDALPNVDAVKHVFDQLDVKGKSVQARIDFSKGLDPMFNKMLERTKGVGADKRFSRVVAKKRGKNVGRFQFFVPPSADDFSGLLRYFAGKGKQGDADLEFFNEALIKPFARADREMSMLRQAILGDYKKLRKEYPDVKKKLGKMMPNSDFTLDNAIRVYLWNKAGFEIPGLSKRDTENLIARVEADVITKAFADALGLISRQEKGYSKPGENWNTETIAYDLQNIATKVSRKKFLGEWIENKDEIFTPENLNKIEAIYGTDFREALKDVLYRMENGTNRSSGKNYGQGWTNWVNGSVGAIMFFNSRSAVLQTLSMVNFINFEDNNIFKAGKAVANTKQLYKDFTFLFNSDFLKNRRAGLATNVNEAELANAVAGATNKTKAAIAYLLKIGFTPTQMADSFAIAMGGAPFYRNRLKKYIDQGMDQKAAEDQAFLDFQEIAEETQQSARPDRISQQQASPLGRLILAFANTPMQYNRLIKKAAGDIINSRGDIKTNISRILYYGAIQNAIFASLQNAIFALAFDDDEDEEMLDKKSERVLNSMLDSLLRGSGVAGAAAATVKNVILEFMAQSERGYKADYGEVMVEALNVSPPIGSKARKLYSAQKTYKFNRDAMGEMDTFDYNNPIWDAAGNLTSAAFNLPLDRAIRKIDNLREAFNQENSAMQRTFLTLGWSAWDLNVGEEMIMNKGKSNEYVKLMPLKQKAQYEAEKKMDAREKKKKKARQQRCTKIKSSGGRCKVMVDKPKKRCHFHD